ncbi:helix-turn-helix transcriptional regulator [Faecalibaculum rodentium]|jgi:transcriptional regulator with XRE-family HTH domain|uniref:helix-turn-helix transcriptional regulator n=4 Tax=Faecalibaculum rodentium TaxID=1702221 RepID=UPI00256F4B9E|nr:helix-turn-helix transcriptional regulator [Faecalibaculum rodentium]
MSKSFDTGFLVMTTEFAVCFRQPPATMDPGHGTPAGRKEQKMEIAVQIRKHRTESGLSQKDLADKIYVTRQTVSNWENGKSYPDIQSLLLLSQLFGVTVDQLIKGDLETMKQEISQEAVDTFNRESRIFAAMCIVSAVTFIPAAALGFSRNQWWVLGLWVFLYGLTMHEAFRVEKLKKNHNLHTYREIVAYSEGRTLEELEAAEERGKRPYQAVFKVLAGAAVGVLLAALAIWVAEFFGG